MFTGTRINHNKEYLTQRAMLLQLYSLLLHEQNIHDILIYTEVVNRIKKELQEKGLFDQDEIALYWTARIHSSI